MTTYRVLLPHPLEPRLLLMHAHGAWRLPEWEEAAVHSWYETDQVNRGVASRFGMECSVLRCVGVAGSEAHELRVYELENHSAPHDMIPAATWIGRSELSLLSIADGDTRELLQHWFSREAGEQPLRGSPWMRRGWYAEALAWTTARLAEIGAAPLRAPEQLRGWERSFVMRITTEQGVFYFKALPTLFGHEAALLQWLSRHFRDNVPQVVAIDAARGWMLQRAVAADALPLAEVREEEEWYRAVRRLAEIQLECSARTRELSELGCPQRGLEMLARRIPRLCTDVDALRTGRARGLSRHEAMRVAALAPTLLTLCEELASYDIPDSLEHGDLTASNILSAFAGPLYVDWSDSSISHPFFSISQLMTEAVSLLPATSREARRRLRDSYLAPWSAYVPPAPLLRAFEIARVLAPVHAAATAHAELLPAIGYRWEVEDIVPDNMRRALRLLGDADSPVSIAT